MHLPAACGTKWISLLLQRLYFHPNTWDSQEMVERTWLLETGFKPTVPQSQIPCHNHSANTQVKRRAQHPPVACPACSAGTVGHHQPLHTRPDDRGQQTSSPDSPAQHPGKPGAAPLHSLHDVLEPGSTQKTQGLLVANVIHTLFLFSVYEEIETVKTGLFCYFFLDHITS